MGSLSNDHGDDNENKKAKGLDWQNNNAPFLYIFLPLVHDYDVKMPNFITFFGESEHKRTTFLFFSWNSRQSLKIQLQKIYQNLTNRTRWNKRDIVWTCASSLFKSKLPIISIGSIGSSRLCACFELWSRRHGKLLFFRGQTEKPMKSLARSLYQCEIKDEACSFRSTDAWGTYIYPRGDQYRFLGNCPLTPSLTQHFALSEK